MVIFNFQRNIKMVFIYCYNELNHRYFNFKTLYKHLKLSQNILENIVLTLETLIGGYFSAKRLKFQLKNLFSERRGWNFPLGDAIIVCIYKIIQHNPLFKYGEKPELEYRCLRCRNSVGIFKRIKKPAVRETKKLGFYLCFCFDVKE